MMLVDTFSMRPQQKAEILAEKTFYGFDAPEFETGGREQFCYLLKAGLYPESKVMDIGCGILRAGYWLVHFLDAGCYYGIEPHAGRLDMGVNMILEPDTFMQKKPRFDTNPNFDTSVFGTKFDFFLAYSIWTHASKAQIQTMLESFLADSEPDGIFLTTYLPANWRHHDYEGDLWVGTSHESTVRGCIYHRKSWIETECQRRGLSVETLGRDKTYGQTWLKIKRYGKMAKP